MISGEYWLTGDGSSTFADGDVGDYNHAMYAFGSAVGLDEDQLSKLYDAGVEANANGIDFRAAARAWIEENLDEQYHEMDWTDPALLQAIRESDVDLKCVQEYVALWGPDVESRCSDEDVISALGMAYLIEAGADKEYIEWLLSDLQGDPRDYAIEHMGWIRVQGDNFQMWTFGDGELAEIRGFDGFPETDDDDADLQQSSQEIGIEEVSTGRHFSIPLQMIFNERLDAAAIIRMMNDREEFEKYKRATKQYEGEEHEHLALNPPKLDAITNMPTGAGMKGLVFASPSGIVTYSWFVNENTGCPHHQLIEDFLYEKLEGMRDDIESGRISRLAYTSNVESDLGHEIQIIMTEDGTRKFIPEIVRASIAPDKGTDYLRIFYGGKKVYSGPIAKYVAAQVKCNPPSHEFVAAFKSPKSGKVFVGATHGDAFAESDIDSVDDLTQNEFLDAEGFSLPDGTGFISREEALEQLGFSCTEDRNPDSSSVRSNPPKLNAAFWKWFGDSAVRNADGSPKVVYHGTRHKFGVFDSSRGVYFTTDMELAESWAEQRGSGEPIVVAAYLSIKNPKIVVHRGAGKGCESSFLTQDRIRGYEESGYDGLICMLGNGKVYEIVAFHDWQIKSIDNDGTWDADDPNIRSNPADGIGEE